jgi:hypothetical protein
MTSENTDPSELIPTTTGTMTVAELQARCEVLEPGIILLREVANGTGDTYRVMVDRVLELGAAFDEFAIVADLTDVSVRPSGRYLEQIRRSMKASTHLAVTRPRSAFLRVVADFVIARFSNKTSSHDSIESAVATCRSRLGRTHKEAR